MHVNITFLPRWLCKIAQRNMSYAFDAVTQPCGNLRRIHVPIGIIKLLKLWFVDSQTVKDEREV